MPIAWKNGIALTAHSVRLIYKQSGNCNFYHINNSFTGFLTWQSQNQKGKK